METNKERQFTHLKPADTLYEEDRHHRIAVSSGGEVVGFVEFEYANNTFPLYYIRFMSVKDKYRGSGFGRELVEKINDFLNKKNRAGILVDAIDAINENSPAVGMYERHGWKPVPGKEGWLAYNLPKNLKEGRLEKAIYEIDNREVKNIIAQRPEE